MITLAYVESVEFGQIRMYADLAVLTGDIIFCGASYYQGGNPQMTPSVIPVRTIGTQTVRASNGDITLSAYEALGAGTLRIAIWAQSSYNLDAYAVVFRPSEPFSNVNAYMATKVSASRVWTDPLMVLAGEYVFCGQYCSNSSYPVRSTPQAADKSGTAEIAVSKYSLPEGATGSGNSFFEIIRVDGDGSFSYYGPNPSVMRITLQGDPAVLMEQIMTNNFVLV